MRGAADQVKRVTLELGGKSANVVFADADLERAAATAPYGVFDNAGQDCCARSRILVERTVYDRFMELLEPAVQGCPGRGPGLDTAEMGPLITRGQWETVASLRPRRCTGRLPRVCPDGPGFWFPPTVLAPVEPAGPQRSARRSSVRWSSSPPFEDEADAIRLANDSDYGLSGSIWTRDVARAFRVSRAVETGQPLGQLALVGALLDAVRRLQAVGPRS